jgi:hypothetical protein
MQHWDLTTRIGEMSMPRQPTTHQFDLFSGPTTVETAQIPPWQALSEETRRRLIGLMVHLILDHVDGGRAVQREGGDHDA